jgi:hypothetical protein
VPDPEAPLAAFTALNLNAISSKQMKQLNISASESAALSHPNRTLASELRQHPFADNRTRAARHVQREFGPRTAGQGISHLLGSCSAVLPFHTTARGLCCRAPAAVLTPKGKPERGHHDEGAAEYRSCQQGDNGTVGRERHG